VAERVRPGERQGPSGSCTPEERRKGRKSFGRGRKPAGTFLPAPRHPRPKAGPQGISHLITTFILKTGQEPGRARTVAVWRAPCRSPRFTTAEKRARQGPPRSFPLRRPQPASAGDRLRIEIGAFLKAVDQHPKGRGGNRASLMVRCRTRWRCRSCRFADAVEERRRHIFFVRRNLTDGIRGRCWRLARRASPMVRCGRELEATGPQR